MGVQGSATPSIAGQRLGRYQIVSALATGGMAELWLALESNLGKRARRKVVLKTMLPERADSPEFVRMFQTEAAIGARLKHPNLVGILEYGRLSDRLFIAMEHVDGLNLRQLGRRLQKQERAFPLPLLLSVITDVCRGLHSAHHVRDRRGPLQFIHRDVSPENIMVTRTGAAKLIDFGAARTARLSYSSNRFVGKLAYVAPERLDGRGEDLRGDVYSVGVILYEYITGARPFEGAEESMIARILAGQPLPPSQVVAGLPSELVQITLKAMSAKPKDRHQSAAALADDLEALRVTMLRGTGTAAVVGMPAGLFEERESSAPDAKTVSMGVDLLRGMLKETREEATVVRELPIDRHGLVVAQAPVASPAVALAAAAAAPVRRKSAESSRSPVRKSVISGQPLFPPGAAMPLSPLTPPPTAPVAMTAIGPAPCAQATPASSWVFERRKRPGAVSGQAITQWLRAEGLGAPRATTTVQMKLDLASALKMARPTLGQGAGVALYRVLRQVALEDNIGRGSGEIAGLAGKKLGRSLGLTTVEDFLSLCASLKIGIIRMPVMTDNLVHVDIYECVTCTGLDHLGCPQCHFEGGLIAGVIEGLVRRPTQVREVSCIGGLGDESCGFDLEFG